jgi:hypothetical protein
MFKKICAYLQIKDPRRFRWFLWIFIVSLLFLVLLYVCKEKVFYNDAVNGVDNIGRFFWVLPFSFIGFSFLSFSYAKNGGAADDPWASYLFSYFPRLIVFSLIIFSVLHLFPVTSGYIYYFLSSGLALYLGINAHIKLEDFLKRNQ